MVERKEYLQKLWSWKDEQVIKVVTGIRRCGKSTLLKQYQNKLKSAGVTEEQIISINFEELEGKEQSEIEHILSILSEQASYGVDDLAHNLKN
jgi:predicted AAA+ superfamily ATPase